ncbi:biotin/lipoyl-containing protein, partial [Mesorhizobium sp. M0276]|uniref:biotin/lipoyl-containing protein n=1 Tax=Mesorhizobium sp. M0276 TaxID=2956928 RepID=UPI003335CA35
MPINITMPALSPTMEEGNLSKWLVKEGDKVSPGDVIAEIETDKATMEVEAVDEGTVAKLVVPAGTEGVKVNALIAVLAAEGEDAAAAAKNGGAAEPAKAEAPKAETPKAEAPKAETPKAEPAATAPKAESAPVANGHATGERTFASPLARRIAREAGVDVSAVTGTGPHGRVVKADVDAAIAGGGAKAPAAKAAPAGAPAAAPAVKTMSDDQVLKLFEQGSYELVPHDNMRKTIARRLVEAKTTIPHFYLTLDCELDALLALRTQ